MIFSVDIGVVFFRLNKIKFLKFRNQQIIKKPVLPNLYRKIMTNCGKTKSLDTFKYVDNSTITEHSICKIDDTLVARALMSSNLFSVTGSEIFSLRKLTSDTLVLFTFAP